MTREECEQFIGNKLKEIWEVYSKYNPNGHYLTMAVVDNGISANNEYYGVDADKPIDFYLFINEKERD